MHAVLVLKNHFSGENLPYSCAAVNFHTLTGEDFPCLLNDQVIRHGQHGGQHRHNGNFGSKGTEQRCKFYANDAAANDYNG